MRDSRFFPSVEWLANELSQLRAQVRNLASKPGLAHSSIEDGSVDEYDANGRAVAITDPLPSGVTFVSADSGCSNASGTVTCTIGGLANGASAARTIVVSPTVANPSLSNTATASPLRTPRAVVHHGFR